MWQGKGVICTSVEQCAEELLTFAIVWTIQAVISLIALQLQVRGLGERETLGEGRCLHVSPHSTPLFSFLIPTPTAVISEPSPPVI